MKGKKKLAIATLALLLAMQAGAQARDWIPINDELSMDPASIAPQGALKKVTIRLKGKVHDVLIFCKKRALLFNEEMVAASDTPAGTSLVSKVCDDHKEWYEVLK